MNPSPVEILSSVFFGLAVLHTFSVKRFAHWAHTPAVAATITPVLEVAKWRMRRAG